MNSLRQLAEPRSLKKIQSFIKRRKFENTGKTNFYINQLVFTLGDSIPIPRFVGENFGNLERDTIMVFADDFPRYNWAHSCRYLLFDADSFELYETIKAEFPPFFLTDTDEANFVPFLTPVTFEDEPVPKLTMPEDINSANVYNENGYALLFSGNSDARHVNDLEFAYRVLTRTYKFNPDHIIVLNYDGTVNYRMGTSVKWPGDATSFIMKVNGPGDFTHLQSAFKKLSADLTNNPNGFLFIHTSNHGGSPSAPDKFLCAFGGGIITATDFGHLIATLPAIRDTIIMMEQCHSGGFIQEVLRNSVTPNTSISCACDANNPSMGGKNFNPFAMEWLSAVNLLSPYAKKLISDPDKNKDGKISTREAHDFAAIYTDPGDTPIFNFKNSGDMSSLD